MGLLVAILRLPDFLFSIFLGAWLDRSRRRPAMIASDLLSALALGSIPIAALAHHLTVQQLFVVAFLTGSATMTMFVAEFAYMPNLVRRELLVDANRYLEMSRTFAALVGPGIAGLVVQAVGAPMAIAIDAVSFLVGAAGTASIRKPEPPPPAPTNEPLRRVLSEGVRRLWGQPYVRAITLSLLANNTFWNVLGAVFVLLFVGQRGITPVQLGLIYATASLSSLAGGQLMRPVLDRIGPGRVLVLASAVFCGGTLLRVPAAFVPQPLTFPLLLVAAVAYGMGIMAYNASQFSVRQAAVPNSVRARVEASLTLIVSTGAVTGGLVGGLLGQLIGLRSTLVVACLGIALMLPPVLLSGLATLRDLPETEPA
jgi:MFS family permease